MIPWGGEYKGCIFPFKMQKQKHLHEDGKVFQQIKEFLVRKIQIHFTTKI